MASQSLYQAQVRQTTTMTTKTHSLSESRGDDHHHQRNHHTIMKTRRALNMKTHRFSCLITCGSHTYTEQCLDCCQHARSSYKLVCLFVLLSMGRSLSLSLSLCCCHCRYSTSSSSEHVMVIKVSHRPCVIMSFFNQLLRSYAATLTLSHSFTLSLSLSLSLSAAICLPSRSIPSVHCSMYLRSFLFLFLNSFILLSRPCATCLSLPCLSSCSFFQCLLLCLVHCPSLALSFSNVALGYLSLCPLSFDRAFSFPLFLYVFVQTYPDPDVALQIVQNCNKILTSIHANTQTNKEKNDVHLVLFLSPNILRSRPDPNHRFVEARHGWPPPTVDHPPIPQTVWHTVLQTSP